MAVNKSDPDLTETPMVKASSSSRNPVRRITLVVILIAAVLFAYGIAADRYTPNTSQGLVQAYLVRVSPEVAGRVVEVAVGTDQRVSAGTVLFRLDPDQYATAVRRAEAQLEGAGQAIGASTAAVASAQAKLAEAVSKREQARDQAARMFELVKKGIYPAAKQQEARTMLDSAEAVVSQATAELEKARQALGPQGAANPQIREALAVLAQANLDLERTIVVAPSEGGVTNLSITVGQVLGKGEAAMTYIDIREAWIEAAFRENSIENLKIGDPVEIVLDIQPGRVILGKIAAFGYGVGNRNVDARTGLPSLRHESGWIRSPQPMPVRIEFDKELRPIRVGSQATVMAFPSGNAIMNAIGRIRMRLSAILTYVR